MSGETWRGWRERGEWGWCVHAGYGVCVTTGARNSVLRAACYGQCGRPSPSAVIKHGCIRFDSEHLTTSYKRAQAKPKTGRLPLHDPPPAPVRRATMRATRNMSARAATSRGVSATTRTRSLKRESDPVFLLGPVRTLVSRIKTTRTTASHRMHCHLDMHLARLSPRTHARSAPP